MSLKIDLDDEILRLSEDDHYSVEFKTSVSKYGLSAYPVKGTLKLISKGDKDCCFTCKWCKTESRGYSANDLSFLCKKNAPVSDKGYPLVEAVDICGDFVKKIEK